MELKNQLEITWTGEGEPKFVAYQYRQEATDAIYLDELEGWDEAENFSIQTEQKLFGQGSYVIATTVGERILEIRLNTKFGNETLLREFRQQIVNKMLSGGTITLDYVFYTEGDTTARVETLQGYISALTEWEQADLLTFIRFSVLCADPEPVITTRTA